MLPLFIIMTCFDFLFQYMEYILFNGFDGFEEQREFNYDKCSDNEDESDSDKSDSDKSDSDESDDVSEMTSESTTNHSQDSAYHNEDQNQMENSGAQPATTRILI